MTTSKKLIIVEGPDGAGKTWLAERIAAKLGARFVHHGPYLNIRRGLAQLYVEAMLPAVLGYQDVVMDRAWMSEKIYGAAFRGGADRLQPPALRMLERIATRCEAQVVLCLPPLSNCLEIFRQRHTDEYLASEEQLAEVYREYSWKYEDHTLTRLPVSKIDTFQITTGHELSALRSPNLTTTPHPIGSMSAGNLDASIVIVGESILEHHDGDTLYQAPFVSFRNTSASWWLTERLHELDMHEDQLLWIDVNDPDFEAIIQTQTRSHICALGKAADDTLHDCGFRNYASFSTVSEAKHYGRRSRKPYRFFTYLEEDLK